MVRVRRYHLGTTWWVELRVPLSSSSSSSLKSSTAVSASSVDPVGAPVVSSSTA